jgi:hypothetical protein
MTSVKKLAKEGIASRGLISVMKTKLKRQDSEISSLKSEADGFKRRELGGGITGHLSLYQQFQSAFRRSPKRLAAAIDSIIKAPPEQTVSAQEHQQKNHRQEVI